MFRRALRLFLQALGFALCLTGGMWVLQGFGLMAWPANSFMLDETVWGLRGLIAFALGAFLVWVGFRKL